MPTNSKLPSKPRKPRQTPSFQPSDEKSSDWHPRPKKNERPLESHRKPLTRPEKRLSGSKR